MGRKQAHTKKAPSFSQDDARESNPIVDQPLKAKKRERFFKIFFTEVRGYMYLTQADSEEEAKEKWKGEYEEDTANSKVVWSGVEDVTVSEVDPDGKARHDAGHSV